MNDLKKLVESYGKFKVSNLGNGLTRIHAHNDRFTLGVICTENKLRGSIKTRDGKDLYSINNENLSFNDVKSKLEQLCTMYRNAVNAFESVKSDEDVTKNDLDVKDDEKEILLDSSDDDDVDLPGVKKVDTDGKVVVGLSGRIVASAQGEKLNEESVDDIVIEDPVTSVKSDKVTTAKDTGLNKDDESDEDQKLDIDDDEPNNTDEGSTDDLSDEGDSTDADDNNSDGNLSDDELADNINDISLQVVGLADTISELASKLGDSAPDKKLIVTGLSSTMYTVACDLKSFVNDFLNVTGDVKESLAVPAKTNYIDLARGGINQARCALDGKCEDKKIKTIIDVLNNIDNELTTQF